jgi:hypothetical protein
VEAQAHPVAVSIGIRVIGGMIGAPAEEVK